MGTFKHGIHPPEKKEISGDKKIRRFPFSPYLIILLSQHIGRPAKPIVKEGQEVVRGQKIAEADGFVSVPMHSPATGVIKKVGTSLDFDGKMTPSIVIEPYPGSEQSVQTGQDVNVDALKPEEIVKAVQEMGMVGLGGAAFPTHVKFSPPKDKPIRTLIINGAECEPYLTSDYRVMLEQAKRILRGTKIVLKALKAEEAIIGIEDNKKDAAQVLKDTIAIDDSAVNFIKVELLKTKYPQGAEKMLTKALVNKEIPSGGLPADIGVIVSNIATVSEIGELMPKGQGLIERVVTLSGKGIDNPGNYLVPLGTPLEFVLEQAGINDKARQIIFGGPMMGKSAAYLEVPITKGTSGIVVLSEDEVIPRNQKVYPCIRCGECVNVCPLYLNPSRLGILARNDEYDKMAEEFNLNDCFECGSCAYVCPSNIPLTQYFRIAKKVLREGRKRKESMVGTPEA
ncbi:MAG: electron transport complex subunit RsxC [Spirochaetia bacterium]|nr:electron transport complex subunit RsxC [Spirochaetia bacterium]